MAAAVMGLSQHEAKADGFAVLAIDANPAGSEPTSPGGIDPCVRVTSGAAFDIDIQIRSVTDLLGWEAYFVYDRSALEITGKNVKMFQAADPNSNIIDGSEQLPDDDGRYLLAAAEVAHSADSGSGVLARINMRAKAPGLTRLSLPPIDVNGDGKVDLGVILSDPRGNPIGDNNGDGFFDGDIFGAQVAVDTPCPNVTAPPIPTPPPTPEPTPAPTPAPTANPTVPPATPRASAAASGTPAPTSTGTPAGTPTNSTARATSSGENTRSAAASASPKASASSDPPGDDEGGSSSTGLIVAGSVGGVIVLVSLATAGSLVLRRRRRP